METIQEIIKQFDVTKDNQAFIEIMKRLKTEELLWVAYMSESKNFYLDFENEKPTAYIFTERQFYEEYSDFMKHRKILVKIVEIKKEQRMMFFSELYRSGFEQIMLDNGQKHLVINLFDIIEKPDFSSIPENKRPVFNPSLICAANNFFQGMNNNRVDHDLEAIMFKEILQAKFLIPLDISKLNLEKANSDGQIDKNDIQIPIITNTQNERFVPIFTDLNEFRRFDPQQKLSANVVTFKEFKIFIEAGDIAINPFGINIILNEEMLSNIESIGNGSSQTTSGYVQGKEKVSDWTREHVEVKDTNVVFGELTEYPQEMIDEICKYLKSDKKISAAYLRLIEKESEQAYLIVVDFDGDKNEVFDGIAKAGSTLSNGKRLEFAALSSEFGKEAVANVEPFYKKKKFGIFG